MDGLNVRGNRDGRTSPASVLGGEEHERERVHSDNACGGKEDRILRFLTPEFVFFFFFF